jgi:hypothetical protein
MRLQSLIIARRTFSFTLLAAAGLLQACGGGTAPQATGQIQATAVHAAYPAVAEPAARSDVQPPDMNSAPGGAGLVYEVHPQLFTSAAVEVEPASLNGADNPDER